jgi:hypothetical protein
MKHLSYFFTIFVFLAFACSKDDLLNTDQSGDQLLKNANLKCAGKVIKVLPNGADDTQPILEAFAQAKSAGPGSVVQLAEGTFKIRFIEVWDFEGYFRGAGKGKTIITNLPDLPQGEVLSNFKYPALIKFVGGNLSMTNMTIHLNDGSCAPPDLDPLGGDLYSILFLADASIDHIPPVRYIKAAVDNVDFIAGYDGGTGYSPFGPSLYNVWSSIMVASDDQSSGLPPIGDISITHCKMENDIFGTWIWSFDKQSSANIENNLFTGGAMQILLATCLGSEIKIRNNQFQKGSIYDLYIDNLNWYYAPEGWASQRSHFTIISNNFQSPQGVISLGMIDARRPAFPNEGFPQLFDVMGNSFNTQDGGVAIQSSNNVDAKIWNNRFSGTGAMGVSVDGDAASSTYADNINLMGNSFFGANYTDASVYLGPYSRNCKVVGVKADNVIDNGVNNSIIGVKAHKGGIHNGQHPNDHFGSVHENMIRHGRW